MKPSSFWSALWAQPFGPHSLLSRYTVANGVLYMVAGLGIFLLPGSVLEILFFVDEFHGQETGMARAIGVCVTVIGWFYIMGGRTRADSFGLSSVVDRLLIPFLLMPLFLTGQVTLGIAHPFSILDPLLGMGAYIIWRRQRRA